MVILLLNKTGKKLSCNCNYMLNY